MTTLGNVKQLDNREAIETLQAIRLDKRTVKVRSGEARLRSPIVRDIKALSKKADKTETEAANELLSKIIVKWKTTGKDTQTGESRAIETDRLSTLEVKALPYKVWKKLIAELQALTQSPTDIDVEFIDSGSILRFDGLTFAFRPVTIGDIEAAEASNKSEVEQSLDFVFSCLQGWNLTNDPQKIDRQSLDHLELRHSAVFQDWAKQVNQSVDYETEELEDYSTKIVFSDGLTIQFREPTALDVEYIEKLRNIESTAAVLKISDRLCLKWGDREGDAVDLDYIKGFDCKYFLAIANHFKSIFADDNNTDT